MVKFSTTIQKFGAQGEKTGWTYVPISAEIANRLKAGCRQSFRVRGKLDTLEIEAMALIPMGDGKFILPLKADIRKKLGKKKGDTLQLNLSEDKKPYQICAELIDCLQDEPGALDHFNKLSGSHKRYFSKWIESAKTTPTRVKRITMAVNALARGWGFPEMIRAGSNEQ
ncbi:YdeI/OmpD-associated family protein [Flavihumibacter fluvii]|uniref:YdeI/OmpD-associated family protein n=1 Tax=Flavihumibacter fluvii TaxID=2838157 RepID=UPI001BDEE3B9|nr:YdeI/OmpD-associated family protein [Flavihumibacter fluvii]ULQ53718.1 YdeI/OmpD-associated family protein [Flavihumibacter fluvii]